MGQWATYRTPRSYMLWTQCVLSCILCTFISTSWFQVPWFKGCDTQGAACYFSVCYSAPMKQYQSMLIPVLSLWNAEFFKVFQTCTQCIHIPPIYQLCVCLPCMDDLVPLEILQNPKYFPYFTDAIGAIDSTHIPCHSNSKEHNAAHNHKRMLTQNCLATCTFNMSFLYVLIWVQLTHALG